MYVDTWDEGSFNFAAGTDEELDLLVTVSCRNGDEFTEESELDKHTCLYLVRGILTLNEVEWEGVVEHAHFLCEDVDDPIEFEYDNINDVE